MRYVVVLDFGYPTRLANLPCSSIGDLARYTLAHYAIYPATVILAQDYTYDYMVALRDLSNQEVDRINAAGTPFINPVQYQYPAEIVKIEVGQSTTAGLENGGSYHVLKAAAEMITKLEQQRTGQQATHAQEVTLIAHRSHAPRASLQAEKLGLITEIPSDLPAKFHTMAAQWWCRSKWAWCLRELIGYIPLKLAGQI